MHTSSMALAELPPEEIPEVDAIVFRKSQVPNHEQREQFLELLAEGLPTGLAAKRVGSTGTKFRGLRKRDRAFDRMCAAAERYQPEGAKDTLRMELWQIALDERHPKRFEALTKLAEALLPEFEHKRVRTNRQDGPIDLRLLVSQERLAGMSDEKLDMLEELLEDLEAKRQTITPALVREITG